MKKSNEAPPAWTGSEGQTNNKLNVEAFTLRAIATLRLPGKKGLHTVWSGFNTAFRQYFNLDPVEEMKRLAKEGKIDMHPIKGGAMIYLHGEMSMQSPSVDEVLKKMGV